MFSISRKKVVSKARVPLFLHNTLSGKKEEFQSLKDRFVRMYNCGPTVYDVQHIGNLRPYVFADILRRTLEYNGYNVTQVVNITDVGHLTSDADEGEDKIEKAAVKTGKKATDIVEEVTNIFLGDLSKLGIDTEKITFPRATEHIAEQIALVKTLEEKGYTYHTKDGIYFDTSRFPDYGKLGAIDMEGLKGGARVAVGDKKHPTDFALWKFSPQPDLGQATSKRQQEWDSPWGIGFPGWHLECSAMAMKYLGKTFDIHTGGEDHVPIHHNNEIAQSEAATGKPFVRYWLHNAFITIDGQKIAKSVGNAVYLSDIESRGLSPLSYRYWLLTSHYRTPANFTWDALEGAHTALVRLYHAIANLRAEASSLRATPILSRGSEAIQGPAKKFLELFHKAINDDLDTPKALALIFDLMKDESVKSADKYATLADFDRVLGLGLLDIDEAALAKLEGEVLGEDTPDDVRVLLAARQEARDRGDFTEADRLREEIRQKGYDVDDTPNGQVLTKK